MRKITAYTDGSCEPNPGVGGWGWVIYDNITTLSCDATQGCLRDNGIERVKRVPLIISDYGGLEKSTNNQMELTAMAELLDSIPHGIYVDVYSDSDYVLGGIIGKNTRTLTRVKPEPQGWLKGWVNGRVSKSCEKYTEKYWIKDVKNGYEWYRIHQALLKHAKAGTVINFCWVKGHSGVEGNEEADRLASKFMKKMHT